MRLYGEHWFSVQAVACTEIISFPYSSPAIRRESQAGMSGYGYKQTIRPCHGHVPTTERTLDPAATDGELDIRLAIKERQTQVFGTGSGLYGNHIFSVFVAGHQTGEPSRNVRLWL